MPEIPAEVAALKDKMLQKKYYVMFRKPLAHEKAQPVLLDHYNWIIELEKRGVVFASGPLFEKDGAQGVGMTVFRVDSWDEAHELAKSDPFCTAGAVDFEIKQWQVNEGTVNVTVHFSDQSYKFS